MNQSSASNLFDQLPHGYRIDRRFGPVYDRIPSGADDLTLIRGIDTRQAVILNRLGVYFLAQIALWEHREANLFADELGMSASSLIQEGWIEQAQIICRPRPEGPSTHAPHLPASVVRTLSLLACAVLVGSLLVYWLNLRTNAPLRGVLSADITSIRVPAESRLIAAHVQAGQEVFTGDPLLTLEKTEHLTLISQQEQRVQELERSLQQAEARAALDLAWRTRELERELSDMRARAHLIREVKRTAADEPFRPATATSPEETPGVLSPVVPTQPVSQSRTENQARPPARPNTMIFISGESGESSIDVERPARLKIPAITRPQPVVLRSEPKADGMLTVEAQNVELQLHRLEELRDELPQQVRRAAGVENIRVQYDEASHRLTEMKTASRDVGVSCPAYGKVGQIRYQPGDTMSTGDVMLKILHSDRRYVVLNVPTRRVNEIQPGTIVDLIFPGDNLYQGRVANLPMLAECSLPDGPSLVTVRVEPTGRLWPEIPIGSQIDVVVRRRQSL
ncbi:MAG: hypothetical protein RIK87_11355 [Fuerstiella sp.]